MAQNNVASEVAKASRELADIQDELREVHGEPVAKYPSMTIYADTHGHEHSEIAEYHNDQHGTDLSGRDVGEWMHEQARGTDFSWSVADPIVVLHD